MDSTGIPVYGEQEHSAYNGHFESTGYHPLLLFNGWEMADHRECCDEKWFPNLANRRDERTMMRFRGPSKETPA